MKRYLLFEWNRIRTGFWFVPLAMGMTFTIMVLLTLTVVMKGVIGVPISFQSSYGTSVEWLYWIELFFEVPVLFVAAAYVLYFGWTKRWVAFRRKKKAK